MPLPYSKKETEYQTQATRSVFLYGHPNKHKLDVLRMIQNMATSYANDCVTGIDANADRFFFQLVKNDKKDPLVRSFEKQIRPKGWNSAFCQNVFDTSFTVLSNRLGMIRHDMMCRTYNIFTASKVLFAASVTGRSRQQMINTMEEVVAGYKKPSKFHLETLETLKAMSDDEFAFEMDEFRDNYAMACLEHALPRIRRAPIYVDTRLGALEESVNVQAPYVVTVSNPLVKNSRISIPVTPSRNGARRLKQYPVAKTFTLSISDDGVLKCGVAFTKKAAKPSYDAVIGVDVGINDCLYTSDGGRCGSMSSVIDYYQNVVERDFANLSELRNKKRSICHYLRTHDLPEDVRRSLIRKADTLEHMIREAKAPYRHKRRYYGMLDHEIRRSVDALLDDVGPDTLVVLEKLDIREFDKSRKVNGMLSCFARGKLSQKLMEELNWHGVLYEQVAPDYTSQVCPVCSCLDKNNRDGKRFACLCCGHTDDADHVGAVNIRARHGDTEIRKICSDNPYSHKKMQSELCDLYERRNKAWRKAQNKQTDPAA